MIFLHVSTKLPTSFPHLRLGLVCITGVLALLAVASSILAVRYQQRISEASRYNSAFDFSQAASELMRFQLPLQNVPDDGDLFEVALRHDILDLRIVTEGIEMVEHLGLVKRAGSHLGQGCLFDRLLSASRAGERLAKEGRWQTPSISLLSAACR